MKITFWLLATLVYLGKLRTQGQAFVTKAQGPGGSFNPPGLL